MKDIPVIFGKKGRTTIPLPLRRKLGWQAGDTIRFHLEGDKVVISREISHERPAVKLAAELPALAQILTQYAFAQLAPLVFGGGGSG